MYRGPGPLSAMSDDMIQLCYRVSRDAGFVWVDRRTGTAWHVKATVMLEATSGRILSAHVPETTAPLWDYTDARLRKVANGAAETRRAERRRELWR